MVTSAARTPGAEGTRWASVGCCLEFSTVTRRKEVIVLLLIGALRVSLELHLVVAGCARAA